jgi:hypothetical protein
MNKIAAILTFLFLLLAGPELLAQEATAGLSSPATQVGRPVEMVITVRDARDADVPQTIDVPGLRIVLQGRSNRVEMNNFQITTSVTFTYAVVPERAGEFDIPAVEVRAGGRSLSTNPLRLEVLDSGIRPQPGGQPSSPLQSFADPRGVPQTEGLPFFGELVLSKKKAWVGEPVPAELRYYFLSNIGGEVGDRPNLAGEGFTTQKLANVPKREQIVNGENYVVFAFQTSITPAKAGTLEIPPAALEARLQIPGSAPPGFDDFFRNFGGMMPPGMFANSQQVAVETRAEQIEVSALPKQGRPDDFTGAVGKFSMEATANPKKTSAGDPVTLRVVVSGQGNFEAMGAPVLTDDEGWRSYPPSEKFQSGDAINFSGEKVYEFMLVARKDQTQTPGVRFSFFNPDTGQYEILTQAPLPVEARAGEQAATTDAQGEKSAEAPTPTPTPTPPPVAKAAGSASWIPPIWNPAFLMANAMAALVWVVLIAAALIRMAARSESGLRRSRLRRLKSRIATLANCTDEEFLPSAASCLCQLLDLEVRPLEAEARIKNLNLEDTTKAVLLDLLARDAEVKYSYGRPQIPDAALRGRILEALKKIAP